MKPHTQQSAIIMLCLKIAARRSTRSRPRLILRVLHVGDIKSARALEKLLLMASRTKCAPSSLLPVPSRSLSRYVLYLLRFFVSQTLYTYFNVPRELQRTFDRCQGLSRSRLYSILRCSALFPLVVVVPQKLCCFLYVKSEIDTERVYKMRSYVGSYHYNDFSCSKPATQQKARSWPSSRALLAAHGARDASSR